MNKPTPLNREVRTVQGLLPEERLATAVQRTGRALRIAWHLGDRELPGSVLRMHGNEFRKADYAAAGSSGWAVSAGR